MDLDSRMFALTADIDWASEFCIKDFINFAKENGIKPTLFATHKSATVDEAANAGAAEIGLHPNFLPGSTHGSDIRSVVDHVCDLYPQARVFRSHSFMDGTPITQAFLARGFKYDSNLATFLEEDLRPIRHATGIMRLPVFWEDDVHWCHGGTSWNLDDYYDRFLSPGLKIINVHPVHFALNTPNDEFYQSIRNNAGKLSAEEIERRRYRGKGVRTFVSELIGRLRQSKIEFHSLHDLFERFSSHMRLDQPADLGRASIVTADQYKSYWQLNDAERQKQLKELYAQRNATDPYATSRDYNLRELEIAAIMKAIEGEPKGRLVDFGCGNGYTILSLARRLPGWIFEGVDFSQELIDGANALRDQAAGELRSEIVFHCDDAVSRVSHLPGGSLDGVITERFLLNLPSNSAQRDFIHEAARVLRSGGIFLMCEGSMDGFRGLNGLRTAVGLEEIAETGVDNLSSIRFDDDGIENLVQQAGFEILRKDGFSYFFAMSRALYPALIHPRKPKFKSRLNDIAGKLQMNLPFTPGVGSNVLWVLRKN